MTRGTTAFVNPEMLVWARKERGYELEEAAKKIDISALKLRNIEEGNEYLSFAQLRNAAWAYRRPTAIFFLKETPSPMKIPAFRRLPSHKDEPLSPNLRLEIRRIYQKRNAAIELSEFGPDISWSYVGSVNLNEDPEKVGLRICKMLEIPDRYAIGKDDSQILAFWRSALEKVGILVFLITDVEVEEMRGFSIAETPYPVVAINRRDASRARPFTLLHEFCHILIKDSSLCEISHSHLADSSQSHEQYCNHVAGAILVPSHLLLNEIAVKKHGSSDSWSEKELQMLASRFKVSKYVILRRLLTLELTSSSFYGRKQKEWSGRIPVKKASGGGGESIHEKVLRTDGKVYTSIVLDAMNSGRITAGDVAELLGMNLKHLSALESIVAGKE